MSMKIPRYNANERELHDKLKSLRNSIYAHSNVDLYKVRPISFDGKAHAVVHLPVLKLTREETETVRSMIARTTRSINDTLQAIIGRVEE